jgi:hypothetical protein
MAPMWPIGRDPRLRQCDREQSRSTDEQGPSDADGTIGGHQRRAKSQGKRGGYERGRSPRSPPLFVLNKFLE